VATGAYDPWGAQNLGDEYKLRDDVMRRRCAQHNASYIEPTTGAVYYQNGVEVPGTRQMGGWINGSTRKKAVGSDGNHQTDFGQKLWAYRMAAAYQLIKTTGP
jgi:hypothetical protein